MNHERAKDILELCRLDNVEDLNDPLIAEALEQLDLDSELSAWFEEQQMQDEKIRTELNRITVPTDLKASILDGMLVRASSEKSVESSSPQKASPVFWFRPWMGIAALFVFASVFLVLQNQNTAPQITDNNSPADSFATIDKEPFVAGVPDVIQFLGQQLEEFNSSKFNKRSEQVAELKNYLQLAGAPSPAIVPKSLEDLPTIGCVSFDYNGTQLSMICFKNGQVYHLITADKAHFKDSRLPNLSPADVYYFEHLDQAFKIWSSDDQIYILTTKGTKRDIPDVPEFI